MKIAIAGTSGLAQHLAYHINEAANYAFIMLSRAPKPELEELGYQIMVVDYESQDDLRFALRGVDLVISTIAGTSQINLIDAAAHARVQRFVPSEFEGPISHRDRNDALDRTRGSRESLERLRHYNDHPRLRMRTTVFACGVFYERFARGGLESRKIGIGSGNEGEGAYLMNMGANTAEIVETNAEGRPVKICMTAVADVARFVVAALESRLDYWPQEFRMMGDKRTVTEIVEYGEAVKGVTFHTSVYAAHQLVPHLTHAIQEEDWAKFRRMGALIATAERRYDYSITSTAHVKNLNELVDVRPATFWDWLRQEWGAE